MSKRYGRNQKRQARERIASLEEAYEREKGLLAWQSQKLGEFEDWENRLSRVVPQYSALRKDTAVVGMDHDPGDSTFVGSWSSKMPRLGSIDDSPYAQTSAIERLRMNVLRVETRPDDFRYALRFELRVGSTPCKKVMYVVSDDLLQVQDYDDVEHYVAREVSKGMIQHLKNA